MSTSILYQEIHEQPAALRRMLDAERGRVASLARDLAGHFDYVLIAARGSSDNAARYAQYLFGAHNGLQVALATPSLFTIYKRPPNLAGALVIGISQSGQSPDIVQVLDTARQQGRPTIAITNLPESPLAQAAAHVIGLHAGQEKAIAATKTYTTSLAALALFSAQLEGSAARLAELDQAPAVMETTLKNLAAVTGRVERYRYMEHCTVIGRGFNYASAFEIALKIKELTRTVAEPYSSADFRHGPIAMVGDGFPVMVVAPTSAVSPDVRELVSDVRRRKGELLLISDDPALLDQAHLPLPIPSGLAEWLSPLVAVLPGQLFGLSLALARGLDPDQPQGIQKVTETL